MLNSTSDGDVTTEKSGDSLPSQVIFGFGLQSVIERILESWLNPGICGTENEVVVCELSRRRCGGILLLTRLEYVGIP